MKYHDPANLNAEQLKHVYKWIWRNDLNAADRFFILIDIIGIVLWFAVAVLAIVSMYWFGIGGMYNWIWGSALILVMMMVIIFNSFKDFRKDYLIKVNKK